MGNAGRVGPYYRYDPWTGEIADSPGRFVQARDWEYVRGCGVNWRDDLTNRRGRMVKTIADLPSVDNYREEMKRIGGDACLEHTVRYSIPVEVRLRMYWKLSAPMSVPDYYQKPYDETFNPSANGGRGLYPTSGMKRSRGGEPSAKRRALFEPISATTSGSKMDSAEVARIREEARAEVMAEMRANVLVPMRKAVDDRTSILNGKYTARQLLPDMTCVAGQYAAALDNFLGEVERCDAALRDRGGARREAEDAKAEVVDNNGTRDRLKLAISERSTAQD